MIDYTTYTVPGTLTFRSDLTAPTNIRIIELGGGIAMAIGNPTGYIVATATQQFKISPSRQIFSSIYGFSASANQAAQPQSYLMYASPATSTNTLVDAYIHCPNTTSATNVNLSYIVIGKLA